MILFDLTAAQGWGTTKQHGGGKYAEIVFEALCKAKAPMVALWDSRRWISENLQELCNQYRIKKIDCAKHELDRVVKDNRITAIYSALPNDEILKYQGCKVIGTLHGLRALEMPLDRLIIWQYPKPFMKKVKFILKSFLPEKMIKRGSLLYYHKFFDNEMLRVVTVSNHTKYAIASFFHDIDIEKLNVFYSPSTSYKEDADKLLDSEKYFLTVSSAREEKNILRAVIAFDKLLSQGCMKGFKMKLTGIERNIFKYKIKNPNNFEYCGYVSEKDLNSLYANAYALVYPSLTEGFGYPPLEAMRYNVPVLASSFTSIYEICGDAALYFNPFSIDEIKNRMLQMLNEDIYTSYSKRARSRYTVVSKRQNEDLKKLVKFIVADND